MTEINKIIAAEKTFLRIAIILVLVSSVVLTVIGVFSAVWGVLLGGIAGIINSWVLVQDTASTLESGNKGKVMGSFIVRILIITLALGISFVFKEISALAAVISLLIIHFGFILYISFAIKDDTSSQ